MNSAIKTGGKVSVNDQFFATVLWTRGSEAAVQEYGTKRVDIFPMIALRDRSAGSK